VRPSARAPSRFLISRRSSGAYHHDRHQESELGSPPTGFAHGGANDAALKGQGETKERHMSDHHKPDGERDEFEIVVELPPSRRGHVPVRAGGRQDRPWRCERRVDHRHVRGGRGHRVLRLTSMARGSGRERASEPEVADRPERALARHGDVLADDWRGVDSAVRSPVATSSGPQPNWPRLHSTTYVRAVAPRCTARSARAPTRTPLGPPGRSSCRRMKPAMQSPDAEAEAPFRNW